jgi:hypothetical protein
MVLRGLDRIVVYRVCCNAVDYVIRVAPLFISNQSTRIGQIAFIFGIFLLVTGPRYTTVSRCLMFLSPSYSVALNPDLHLNTQAAISSEFKAKCKLQPSGKKRRDCAAKEGRFLVSNKL